MTLNEVQTKLAAIRRELDTLDIDSPETTRLLLERDRLRELERELFEPLDSAEAHSRMLDYTFN